MKNFLRINAILLVLLGILTLSSCKKNSNEESFYEYSYVVYEEEIVEEPKVETNKDSQEKQSKDEKESETKVEEHIHSYVDNVIKPSCTEDGYTIHTCSVCNDSYRDSKTDKLGHVYTNWIVIKASTTEEVGMKECKCDVCNEAKITEEIPKKVFIPKIDPRVTIGTLQWTNYPQYSFKSGYVIDKRTWGEAPEISITNDENMHVIYFDKNNNKVEFDVLCNGNEVIHAFTIKNDGTYGQKIVTDFS